MRYRYRIIEIGEMTARQIAATLDSHGEDGWRLVCVDDGWLYLEKPLVAETARISSLPSRRVAATAA